MAPTINGMSRIKLGIVGAGFGGYGLAPAFCMDSRYELVALSTTSLESQKRAAERFGFPVVSNWKELVLSDEVDAIALAAPPLAVFEIASAALRQGKHVFAEKQLGMDCAQANNLAELADQSGLANMVDYIFPELKTWQLAKKTFDAGKIGELRHVFLDWRMESYDHQHDIEGWKTDRNLGGGVLNHFGSHVFYYLEWLFGPISELSARLLTSHDCRQTGETLAALSIAFLQGGTATVSLCNAATMGSGHRIEVSGTKGSLLLENETENPVEGFELWLGTRKEGVWNLLATENQVGKPEEQDSRVLPVARMAVRFADWISGGVTANPCFRDGARVQALLEASYLSDDNKGKSTTARA
jgi:predicted dehydrogenase